MVQAYAAANDVNVVRLMPLKPRLGLVATGPAYDSLAQALLDVGADDAVLADHGVAALRIGLIHPLDEAAVIDFARGLDEVFVVEDKTSFLESQVRHALYDLPDAERPKVVGKKDRLGNPLVPADGELTPGRLIGPLRRVLGDWVPIDAAHPSDRRCRCCRSAARPTSARAARTTARRPSRRARSPAAASAATPSSPCRAAPTPRSPASRRWAGGPSGSGRRPSPAPTTSSRTSATAPSSTPASSPCRRVSAGVNITFAAPTTTSSR